MLRLLQKLFANRFWRQVGFNELSELYISSMLRNVALSLVGIFVPIYLYQLGYSIGEIFLFLAFSALIRVSVDPLAGRIVGRIGPKHTILCSYGVQIVALILLLTLPLWQWPLLLVGLAWAVASGLFFVAYHIDFSAIEHAEKEGKELASLSILERIGGVLGPLAGGVIATFFGAHYTILATIIFFVVAAQPLLITMEPIPRQKRVRYRGMPTQTITRNWLSFVSLGIEHLIAVGLWPLYVAVFIFVENTYALLGVVVSIGFAVSLITTYAMGKLVDRKKGGQLLRWGASVNSLLHLTRPFVSGFQGVLALNTVNDFLNPAYKMPYMKGWYDSINAYPQFRIAFIVVLEVIGAIAKGSVWLLLWVLTTTTSVQTAMLVGFGLAAVASLGIMLHRFDALRSR